MKRAMKFACLTMCLCILFCSFSVSAYTGDDLVYSYYVSTSSNYASQNCYGYVLGKAINQNPGYRTGSTYNTHAAFRACIISDLTSLGYSVTIATTPYATLSANEFMIAYCIGKWSGTYNNISYETDNFAYHFWRKNYGSSNWYHKYGTNSGKMRFKYAPTATNYYRTSNEYYNGITGAFCPATVFAASTCTWGYLIVSLGTVNNAGEAAESIWETNNHSDYTDNSAAAQIARLFEGA